MAVYEPTLQVLLLLFGGVGLLVVLFSNMKISKKVAIVVTAITLITIASYLVPPEPKGTMYLSIEKVDYYELYFVLDEEMEVYPLFHSILDEMEAEGREYGWIHIPYEEYKNMDLYLPAPFFKYESNFYDHGTAIGSYIIGPEEGVPEPAYRFVRVSITKIDHPYFVLSEEIETYPLFRSAIDKMKAEECKIGQVEITLEEIGKLPPFDYFKYESNFYEITIVV
ncbi:MAG: hypothetical protein LRZ87_02375 [Methanocellales archaeon]|nr:hypothetical protein [Methanocellales archaeon]